MVMANSAVSQFRIRCFLAAFIGMIGNTNSAIFAEEESSIQKSPRYSIVIHGGASGAPGKMSDQHRRSVEAALSAALKVGQTILADGGTSLEAVEKTIRAMEDDPYFNAGRGAVFNQQGEHELDASIMDGRDKTCGAVAGVRTVKNPITLARLVMQKTSHVLLAGPGADAFAAEVRVERVDPKYFWTKPRFEAWQRTRNREENPDDELKGTVGCVALDSHGNLAAGTSTGGLTGKMAGRVGDSPVIGAGTYADNATCAVSCTGIGEQFIRHAVAYQMSARIRWQEASAEAAGREIIHQVLKPGDGGLIAVDSHGNAVMEFNTPGMARGVADSSGRFEVAIGK